MVLSNLFFLRKRGQITVFIVTGLIIVLLALLIGMILVNEISTEETARAATDPSPIKTFIDSCIDRTANDALFYFGMVGGKVKPDAFRNYLVYDEFYKIPYWFYVTESRMPSNPDVEKILATYMAQNLQKCINNFVPLKDLGWTFTQSTVSSSVSINDADVEFKVTYPVVAQRREIRVEFIDFGTKIPGRFKQMLAISKNIVDAEVKDVQREGEPLIYWSYLTEVGKMKYNITAHADKDDSIVYRIVDPLTLVHNEPYTLQFANKAR